MGNGQHVAIYSGMYQKDLDIEEPTQFSDEPIFVFSATYTTYKSASETCLYSPFFSPMRSNLEIFIAFLIVMLLQKRNGSQSKITM